MADEDNVLDTYFGIASLPVAGIDGTIARHTLNATAAHISAPLLEWHPTGDYDHALVCLAQSYQSAALIYLYRTLRHHRGRDASILAEVIPRQVGSAIHFGEAMPFAALPEGTLLFPLFIGRAETTDSAKMQRVRGRVGEMLAYRRFDNVRIARHVLEEVWDVKRRTNLVIGPDRTIRSTFSSTAAGSWHYPKRVLLPKQDSKFSKERRKRSSQPVEIWWLSREHT